MTEIIEATKLGAHWDGRGVNFALFSAGASGVQLCLFDPQGNETHKMDLPHAKNGVFHGYVPGCLPGQHYGYRVHGKFAPDDGLHFNPAKLVIDPYARQLSGPVQWSEAVFSVAQPENGDDKIERDTLDSAPYMPKAIVQGNSTWPVVKKPAIPWADTIIYELNVRGYTMLHRQIPKADRGRFRALSNAHVLQYLKALGITSIELMPLHYFVDEEFLVEQGLRNYWGYNSLNFFTPDPRFLVNNDPAEFCHMVDAIHDAGLEVILDVVYNHTAEGGNLGPTLSYRGIDNLTYYRTVPGAPGHYINDTGCGNTLNADHPRVQDLVCDSLNYWANDMGVDGYRFDLCPILGRHAHGFDRQHPLLKRIERDAQKNNVKLISEPWDIGPGGYQLGQFSKAWSEWNDQYRDSVRRFWRGDQGEAPTFARRLHGSSDIFEANGRSPRASINFITSHDGFTLHDVVSYEHRHNLANGENNRDGHSHNYSASYGVEGETDDQSVNQLRRRQKLNMMASLLLSQGTPMLLAGDEMGHSQKGNNNAYAQDNEITWINWDKLDLDQTFTDSVRQLLWLRRRTDLISHATYRHGLETNEAGQPNIDWLSPVGEVLTEQQWKHDRALMLLLVDTDTLIEKKARSEAVAILINAALQAVNFTLPAVSTNGQWTQQFASAKIQSGSPDVWQLPDRSCACFTFSSGSLPFP